MLIKFLFFLLSYFFGTFAHHCSKWIALVGLRKLYYLLSLNFKCKKKTSIFIGFCKTIIYIQSVGLIFIYFQLIHFRDLRFLFLHIFFAFHPLFFHNCIETSRVFSLNFPLHQHKVHIPKKFLDLKVGQLHL